ncbi:DNA-directed RNA polymerase subunit beta' [Gallalistipes aquisgranensis]|uniref:DNA-directed RNA polymerase subunit beta' n=1 Tax=Gallalistipes aquisgranensis TaxID=2779358 RepID=UPI001CF90706|nr:DNA-directed RNA polymerase subunit beta' [Gallalistipes aquisgranensis]MBE5034308.1 DNA-directed RNA polymerase subunit beta' [Gallalistipes aquisgranensis]
MSFKKDNKANVSFNKISIGLASPEEILENSSGEVLKPETINYRTYKPERDGLFCERIFGPVKDYECHCGKYKRIRYKGIVCDRCGVEVTEKKVRRERMGHISLVVPVVHIWYFRSLPSKIGYLLGIPSKKLEAIIYYERYIVVQAGAAAASGVNDLDLLAEKEYLDVLASLPKGNAQLDDSDPNKFIAQMGAEAIYTLLQKLDLDALSYQLRHKANTETSQQRKSEALKRLHIVEAFRSSKEINKPEWMVLKVIPVIPPELRPLVPLDGGRFATSDLNDLYRRVIIRNNRLKRLIEIKAPEVILRNEKRMLQEAVDSLFDNSRKSNAVKTESNRPLKSLSDSLKGKQGRFRQNLLGKRVDYSARSVIVVGPELRMHEMGIPKDMAAELYKPFVIRKLIERGIVKTVKSAKKIIDRKDPVIWDILENVIKGHPVLMNRAPTLHRLGIQAFQPKLIEGKALQLHPLACTAFNADFDGDQMAVHLPLGNAAILEAQLLMLGSHNILNPANGAPITVPSQDMVLGLYYITKPKKGVKGEGQVFYGAEEAIIAYNEKRADLHAKVKVMVDNAVAEDGTLKRELIETTVGRILFNQVVPKEVGYINTLLTKKSLRDIIGLVMKKAGADKAADFLDDIKNLGYRMAFQGGLSFNLDAVLIPEEKESLVHEGYERVDEVMESYNAGLITNNERYNQIIDIWTNINSKLTKTVLDHLIADQDGFNPVYMMLDSGARGSKEQIRQLSGMRGLMAKPQKSGAEGGQVIENPILSNFKEGLSVLEYFISTHGARKGLADTALKTADAGYLTRRLVDVAQDVIINEEDCGTLRGLTATAIKRNEDVVQTLYERILGRVALQDVVHPLTGEVMVHAGEEITEDIAEAIEKSPVEQVEIRSVLTCESRKGVCAKCYGRNLATGRMVQKGEVVGVIAAQSIGEPGTQLTLRTFHVGGVAGGVAVDNSVVSRYDGRLEIDELRVVKSKNDAGEEVEVVISRLSELRIVDVNTGITLYTHALPYGAVLFMHDGDMVKKGDRVCEWDPYNAVIISEYEGKISFENIIEGVTYREEADEQTGLREKVIIESRDKTKNPVIKILDKSGEEQKQYNLPVSAHIVVKENAKIKAGDVLIKIPRAIGKAGDITGGLPRVTELFEARNPSNPAIVSEIDGEISFGKIKRGNREIIVTSKGGDIKRYLVPLSRQILVQENDYVRAGMPLSDGAITPSDILAIQGPTKVQEYIVNEVQEVYRMQGVKINDKHFEVIVRQMMNKVQIQDPGDTRFLEEQIVDKWEFMEVNDELYDKVVVTDAGDSQNVQPGQIISVRKLRDENSVLKRKDMKPVEVRDIIPATSNQVLQGITRAALQTSSFMSAASFQETTKVLNEAAIYGKVDPLEKLKENVICGHLIPAGTGIRDYDNLVVGSLDEYNSLTAKR